MQFSVFGILLSSCSNTKSAFFPLNSSDRKICSDNFEIGKETLLYKTIFQRKILFCVRVTGYRRRHQISSLSTTKTKKVTCRVIAENLGGPSKRGEIHKLLLPCTMKSEVEFFDYVSFSKVNSKAFSARAIRKIKSSGLGPC